MIRDSRECPYANRGAGVVGVFMKDGAYSDHGNGEVMFIAEAPGREEQREGVPLIGKAGKTFHRILREVGIREGYVTNVAKQQPPYKDRKQQPPSAEAVECYKPYLMLEVRAVRPKVIVAMGAVAAKAVLRLKGAPSLGSLVNRWYQGEEEVSESILRGYAEAERGSVRVLVLYHPSYLNRMEDKAFYPKLVRDWKRELKKIIGSKPPTYAVAEDPWGIQKLDVTARSVIDVESVPSRSKQKDPDPLHDAMTGLTVLPLTADKALTFTNVVPEYRVPEFENVVMHYGMFDLTHMARRMADRHQYLRRVDVHDTMVMGNTLGLGDLSLKGMGSSFGIDTVTYQNRHEIGEEQYNGQDAWLTKMAMNRLLPDAPLAYEIDRLLLPALVEMQLGEGYHVDMDRLAEAITHYEKTKQRMEQMFYLRYPSLIKHARHREISALEMAPDEARPKPNEAESIGSPDKLAELWGLADTRKETLRMQIGRGHPAAFEMGLVLEWRAAAKRLSSYLYKIRDSGRLNGLFNLTPNEDGEGGTGTGRLSASNGMQTQPPISQRALMAGPGQRLRRGDFSQIELMVAAQLSHDEYLIEVLNDESRNLHTETRDQLKLCGPTSCANKKCAHYTKAKNFNFGAGLYGGGAPYISSVVGCSLSEAVELMAEHRRNWKGWWRYADEHWGEVQRTGKSVEPVTGHTRPISLMNLDSARKQAINHPVQGLAVYVNKAAMYEVWREGDSQLVNQVHDEIQDFVDEAGDPALQNEKMRSIMVETAKRFLPDMNVRVGIVNAKHWEGEP